MNLQFEALATGTWAEAVTNAGLDSDLKNEDLRVNIDPEGF